VYAFVTTSPIEVVTTVLFLSIAHPLTLKTVRDFYTVSTFEQSLESFIFLFFLTKLYAVYSHYCKKCVFSSAIFCNVAPMQMFKLNEPHLFIYPLEKADKNFLFSLEQLLCASLSLPGILIKSRKRRGRKNVEGISLAENLWPRGHIKLFKYLGGPWTTEFNCYKSFAGSLKDCTSSLISSSRFLVFFS
jgi:hypothetical protein